MSGGGDIFADPAVRAAGGVLLLVLGAAAVMAVGWLVGEAIREAPLDTPLRGTRDEPLDTRLRRTRDED